MAKCAKMHGVVSNPKTRRNFSPPFFPFVLFPLFLVQARVRAEFVYLMHEIVHTFQNSLKQVESSNELSTLGKYFLTGVNCHQFTPVTF